MMAARGSGKVFLSGSTGILLRSRPSAFIRGRQRAMADAFGTHN